MTRMPFPVSLNGSRVQWCIAGEGKEACEALDYLLRFKNDEGITLLAPEPQAVLKNRILAHNLPVIDSYQLEQAGNFHLLIAATGNEVLDQSIAEDARQRNILVHTPFEGSDFEFRITTIEKQKRGHTRWLLHPGEQQWKQLTSRLIFLFLVMVLGHILISYLPLPSVREIGTSLRPYFDERFLFFILAGFLAQMVDGSLSMGYGVVSATCLMSAGVNPVAMSAAIHTSEIFTTGVSGYSHYKFGNVNRKLFRHLVVPGVAGAILGALLLVFLDEKYGKWLLPFIALYAGFLGLKILVKAFAKKRSAGKAKRIGWLAGAGGFLDSFGGGGWGPIVTSTLIAKGRSPKYTVGSVSLTEFFVTLSSAFTFFVTVGVSHWNVVLGLITGGMIAAPLAARLAGKLPRKTMMIAVGVMVMIWCVRLVIKSLGV